MTASEVHTGIDVVQKENAIYLEPHIISWGQMHKQRLLPCSVCVLCACSVLSSLRIRLGCWATHGSMAHIRRRDVVQCLKKRLAICSRYYVMSIIHHTNRSCYILLDVDALLVLDACAVLYHIIGSALLSSVWYVLVNDWVITDKWIWIYIFIVFICLFIGL